MDIQLKQRPYKLFTHTKINRLPVNSLCIRGPTALFLPNNDNHSPNTRKWRAAFFHPNAQNAEEGFLLGRTQLCYNWVYQSNTKRHNGGLI